MVEGVRLATAALAVALLTGAEPSPTLQECAALADDIVRLACFDGVAAHAAQPVPPAAPAAPAPAAPPAPATPAAPPADFGLPVKRSEEKAVQSRLAGRVEDLRRGTEFGLENGQIWKVTGELGGLADAVPDHAAVTITRSFSGAYWMKVEGLRREIKVRRVR